MIYASIFFSSKLHLFLSLKLELLMYYLKSFSRRVSQLSVEIIDFEVCSDNIKLPQHQKPFSRAEVVQVTQLKQSFRF